MKRKSTLPIALMAALLPNFLGCDGGGGPVAVPPGVDTSRMEPASTSPGVPPGGPKSRGAKQSLGPMPPPAQ